MQITGHDGVKVLTGKAFSHLESLLPTLFVEFALCLSLHNLAGIVDGLTVPYKKYFCHHAAKLLNNFVTVRLKTAKLLRLSKKNKRIYFVLHSTFRNFGFAELT